MIIPHPFPLRPLPPRVLLHYHISFPRPLPSHKPRPPNASFTRLATTSRHVATTAARPGPPAPVFLRPRSAIASHPVNRNSRVAPNRRARRPSQPAVSDMPATETSLYAPYPERARSSTLYAKERSSRTALFELSVLSFRLSSA